MNKEYGKEITTSSIPIGGSCNIKDINVKYGFLQTQEMKLNDDIYQLTQEEKETLKEILNDYIDWYDDELKITENHTTMSKKCKIIKNILEKLGE